MSGRFIRIRASGIPYDFGLQAIGPVVPPHGMAARGDKLSGHCANSSSAARHDLLPDSGGGVWRRDQGGRVAASFAAVRVNRPQGAGADAGPEPLFDRSIPANRPLRLTLAGRRFYRNTQEILRQCDAARVDLLGEAGEQRRIRVGVLNTLPHEAIAALVQTVAKPAPNVHLEVWEASADRVAGWLAQAGSTWPGRMSTISPPTRAYCGANPWLPWWRRNICSRRRLGHFGSGFGGASVCTPIELRAGCCRLRAVEGRRRDVACDRACRT